LPALSYAEDAVTQRNAFLGDYFDRSSIVEGLKNNDLVRSAIGQHSDIGNPLESIFTNGHLAIGPDKLKLLNGYSFNKFAFDEVSGDKVSVLLELLDQNNSHQTEVNYLKIKLPLPEKLRDSLQKASSGKEGFLFGSNGKTGVYTEFKFNSGQITP